MITKIAPKIKPSVNGMALSILFFTAFPIALILFEGSTSYTDPIIICTFLLNIIFSILLFSHFIWKDGFSMASIYGYFCYFFTGAVPLAMYMSGRWMHGNLSSDSPELIIKANLMIIAYNCIWIWAYLNSRKRLSNIKIIDRINSYTCGEVNFTRAFVLLSLLSALAVGLYMVLGQSLIFRSAQNVGIYALPGGVTTGMIINGAIRPMFIFVAILLTAAWKYGRQDLKWLAVWACFLALATNFPTSVARFYIFVFLVAGLSALTVQNSNKGLISYWMIIAATFGAIIWHPIRWLGTAVFYQTTITEGILERFSLSYFFTGQFDAYENYVLGIEFVEKDGITWGYQLLGAIFSWVPRAFWHSKPLDTGEFLFTDYFYRITDFAYSNIAAPMYLEMYINFGFASILIGAIVFGVLCGFTDNAINYFKNGPRNPIFIRQNLVFIIYISTLTGLSLFFWRGSWMTGNTMLAGFTATIIVVRMLLIESRRRG